MPSHRPSPAFTLIEAIIALVILSVAAPAMFLAVTDAHARRMNPVQDTRARWLAAEKLEDIIADRHSPSRGYGYVISPNYPDESPLAEFPGFSRRVVISETGADLSSAGTGYKTVNVTVTYAGAAGASRAFSLSTVLADYTP